jgi:hypothetical protein
MGEIVFIIKQVIWVFFGGGGGGGGGQKTLYQLTTLSTFRLSKSHPHLTHIRIDHNLCNQFSIHKIKKIQINKNYNFKALANPN